MASMKHILVVCIFFFNLCSTCIGDAVTLTAGPDVSVSYDPSDWNPLSSIRNPDPDAVQSITWKLLRENEGFVQITVASHPDKSDEAKFKKQLLDTQLFRGDPAMLVREHRQSIVGRDWLVFELRNPNTRPPRSEMSYFLPAADGHITIFVVGEEANLPNHREAIESFFRLIRVKSP
jgi:hypothetical protein